ncbi:MAG TPA: outer membrane beta-barrel protein [Burkholderiales bacterium]|nr:outer membrane beta-barrel protein [Burkholderiales bacterium]
MRKTARSPFGLLASRAAAPALLAAMALPLAAGAAEAPEPAAVTPEEPPLISAPTREGVPALQLSTDYGQPALGFGTYAPIGQVDARGFRAGPATVRVATQAAIGYNDNVVLSRTDKIGSMFYTVAPAVSAALEGATQRFYAVYRGNYGAYATGPQNDYADHSVTLAALSSWTDRLRTMLSYDFYRGHTPRGLTVATLSESERWAVHTVRGTVNYGAVGAQGGLQGDVIHQSRRYTTASGASSVGEFDRFELDGTFYYRLGSKTQALIRGRWADIDHPNDATLDNREVHVDVGATWEALAATTGRASVGYTDKKFDVALRPGFSGANFELGASWRPRSYSLVDVSARRFLTETYDIGGSFVINSYVNVLWNHVWNTGIASTLNYAYGRAEQEGLNRTDTYQTLAGRVSYPLRRWARVGAELRHESRDSTAATLEYTRNIMLLTLETAL